MTDKWTMKYKAHDIDFENMKINITGSEFSPQTDFDPPIILYFWWKLSCCRSELT